MAQRKRNLALIFGGRSAERDVSINTAQQIARHLDPHTYRVLPVEIASDGRWLADSPAVRALTASRRRAVIKNPAAAAARLVWFAAGMGLRLPVRRPTAIDVVFLALHGPYGEDGTIQGMLEMLGLRYTCSGVLASALAMDKYRTHRMVEPAGVRVPEHLLVTAAERPDAVRAVRRRLGFPCVVKPLCLGSSVGVSIVRSARDLEDALRRAFAYGRQVLVEKYIDGREVTAAVLGNDDPAALPLIEIRPKVSTFFDYQAKYEVGGSDEICPAPVPAALTREVQSIALRVHRLLGCRGVTRSDFMVDRRGRPYFLEINTIPGMTQTSLVPQAARQAGLSFPQLLDRLVDLALEE